MSTSSSSSDRGSGSRGSVGEQHVKYRDSAAENKYIEGKTSPSGKVHVITHGDTHGHYDPSEPRSSEARANEYSKSAARKERSERDIGN